MYCCYVSTRSNGRPCVDTCFRINACARPSNACIVWSQRNRYCLLQTDAYTLLMLKKSACPLHSPICKDKHQLHSHLNKPSSSRHLAPHSPIDFCGESKTYQICPEWVLLCSVSISLLSGRFAALRFGQSARHVLCEQGLHCDHPGL